LSKGAVEVAASMPLRFYFPDTAVFLARLKPLLAAARAISVEPSYTFAGEDRDLGEIWQAQQVLYAEQPELAELPTDIVASVASLPVEQLRLARSAG
jgi:hypothetical protein